MQSIINKDIISKFPSNEELLSESFLENYKGKQPNWGFSGLGYVIFKRTYARVVNPITRELLNSEQIQYFKDNNLPTDTEEWNETVERCVRGAQKLGAMYTIEQAERLYDLIFNLKCCFSGRGLWQLGTETVDKIGVDSLLNCWVRQISTPDDFAFVFMESMLGGGVGCVISKEYTQELPRVKKGVKCVFKNTKDADYIVPDSKEGWCGLWLKIIEAYLITGKSFSYSTICIRSSGEPIKTFGGIAPGPKPLIDGCHELCKILENREGKKLRTQDVADMICIGGQVVKSGGVRRTALILQGDVDDAAYLGLKRWDLGNIPYYRSNSNNSVLCSKFDHLTDRHWEGFKGNGEPIGLINLKTSKKYGRIPEEIIHGFDLNDDSIIGVNPCAEACMANGESCNLAELFLNNCSSKEEMLECAILLYKTQKAIACGHYIFEETNDIVHKNLRLGLGITGICQRIKELDEWCNFTYDALRRFDEQYSKEINVNQSIRLTVVKPSGTLSLLSGSTPGGHPGFSRYHLRRVRFAAQDPLLRKLKDSGYNIEPEIRFDGSINHDLMIVEFPVKFDKNTIVSSEMTAIDQLNLVKKLQEVWCDQACSVTIYYKIEELADIKKWLSENYDKHIKTVSFLLHSDHGFKQAPLEEITEDQYEKIVRKIKDIKLDTDTGGEIDSQECSNGICPVK